MKNTTLVTLTVLASLMAATPLCSAQEQKISSVEAERGNITKIFQEYQNAIVRRDGLKAAGMISADSTSVYENYRHGALTSSKQELLQIPLIHRAAILVLRGSIAPAELETLTGKDLFARSVEAGLIANKWAEKMEVLSVVFPDTKTAVLTIGVEGKPGTKMAIVRESSGWKVSLREVLMQSNAAIVALLAEKKIKEEDYLKNVVESQLGEGAFEMVWNMDLEGGPAPDGNSQELQPFTPESSAANSEAPSTSPEPIQLTPQGQTVQETPVPANAGTSWQGLP
jgi:hypothetical protein